MKQLALPIVAGAVCLLVTYNITREGSIAVALLVFVAIGAATGVILALLDRARIVKTKTASAVAFVLGAFLSESIAFARYYFAYGYQDPKLTVGIVASVIEFVCIALVGAASLLVALALTSRITGHSSGPPTASADF